MPNLKFILITLFLSALLLAFTTNKEPRLITYIPSECQQELDPFLLIDRVITKELKGDSLYLTLGLKENCCIEFNPAISFAHNTLNIDLDTTPIPTDGEWSVCACDCCFELTLVLTGMNDTTFKVRIDGVEIPQTIHPYKTYPEEYLIYQGDTINRRNQYGLKEGIWITFDDRTQLVKQKEFYNGTYWGERSLWTERYTSGIISSKSSRDTSWSFDENGLLYSMNIMHRKNEPHVLRWCEEFIYHPNGKLKSHCIPSKLGPSYQDFCLNLDSCSYWNENGELLKNEP